MGEAGLDDSLGGLEAALRGELLDLYSTVGQEALGLAVVGGREREADRIGVDLEALHAEIRALRANQANRALPGWQQTPDLDPDEVRSVLRRAAGLNVTVNGAGPADWTLDGERNARASVTTRLTAFGVHDETAVAFRADADFMAAAAACGEGDPAAKKPHYRISYGRPETVRELRFVGSELEAVAAAQLDATKKTVLAHDVQYVVITGALTDAERKQLRAEVSDICAAIKARPGRTYMKAVVAMPATPEGREAQRVADGVCSALNLTPDFGRLVAGTYSKELAGREAEFVKRSMAAAKALGKDIGPKRGGLSL